MPNTVPMNPVRSKKNGSLRTPAKTFAPSLAAVPVPPVEPEPIDAGLERPGVRARVAGHGVRLVPAAPLTKRKT